MLNSHYGQLRVDCASCNFSDNTYNKWVRHLIDEHNLGEEPLPCPGCDKKFSVVHKLRKHYMAYPSGSHGKPKPCPTCTRINTGKGRFRLGSDQCMNCSIRESGGSAEMADIDSEEGARYKRPSVRTASPTESEYRPVTYQF